SLRAMVRVLPRHRTGSEALLAALPGRALAQAQTRASPTQARGRHRVGFRCGASVPAIGRLFPQASLHLCRGSQSRSARGPRHIASASGRGLSTVSATSNNGGAIEMETEQRSDTTLSDNGDGLTDMSDPAEPTLADVEAWVSEQLGQGELASTVLGERAKL